MTPADIDRKAPVIVRLERVIGAPLSRVWTLHIGVAEWPRWQTDIRTTSLDRDLAPGAHFTWTTAGLDAVITSTIYAIEPRRSTLWGGLSGGIMGIHGWSFEAVTDGVRVTTEESWSGNAVASDPAEAKHLLETSLARWLGFLDAAAIGGVALT